MTTKEIDLRHLKTGDRVVHRDEAHRVGIDQNDVGFLAGCEAADAIPESERHGKPLDLFWVWAAANISILGVSYGTYLPAFYGLNLWQALLAGLASGHLTLGIHGFGLVMLSFCPTMDRPGIVAISSLLMPIALVCAISTINPPFAASAPSTIAAAVYAGHRAARELDAALTALTELRRVVATLARSRPRSLR